MNALKSRREPAGAVVAVANQRARLKALYDDYLRQFKAELMDRVRSLSPLDFEIFAGNLLQQYGFTDTQVTRPSRDGGIDGNGKLHVGLVMQNMAFQCKNWTKTVGRPDVDRFRGAIQGKYEQGIFFTTSTFSREAKEASVQPGAVTIVLIDGETIADMMVRHRFGVIVAETLEVPVCGTLGDDLSEGFVHER